eukprot:803169-Amphidinium_carterae.1
MKKIASRKTRRSTTPKNFSAQLRRTYVPCFPQLARCTSSLSSLAVRKGELRPCTSCADMFS